jgi:carboxyl-terminal processing protease
MMKILRHTSLLAAAMVISLVIYHVISGASTTRATAHPSADVADEADQALGAAYELGSLRLLDRTRYYVAEKYVDPDRIHPAEMFGAALDAVERSVNSVLLQYEDGGSFVHVSVGAFTTTLQIASLSTLDDLGRELRRVASVIGDRLEDDTVKPAYIEYAMVNGMLSTLDPHSVLLEPEASREMEVENQGEFGGLGITIRLIKGRLTVEYPLEDTPAYRVGLQPDDHIVRIEDESTINMSIDEAVSKLRGPVGEPVTILVDRDIFDEPQPFTIVRDRIKINPVEGEVLEGGIGYVRIKTFHANTAQDLDAVLAAFRREIGGVPRGVILDLRSNPGGFLNQAVAVANRFVDRGVLVATVAADGARDHEKAQSRGTEPDYPLVVLTNASSASASEIVAGAVKNLDRGVIVGERTFGKGSVQHLYTNADESRLKLTVAHYLTSGDRSIQSLGIPPDIALVPLIVSEGKGESDDDASRKQPLVSLLWRDRMTREADLDHHLGRVRDADQEPVYSVDYLYAPDEVSRRRERADLSKDWEVQFARDVLMASPGARRPDILGAIGNVVKSHAQEQADKIAHAFGALDIDWSVGPVPENPSLALTMEIDGSDALVAGKEQDVIVTVSNDGNETLHQVFVVSESDNEWLDGGEYFFGRIEPGAKRSWSRSIKLAPGYPTESFPVKFKIRDAKGMDFGTVTQLVKAEGKVVPQLRYSLEVVDDGSGKSEGDGDGKADANETIEVQVTVENISSVSAQKVFAKIRNRSGHAIDLQVGTVDLGALDPNEQAIGRFRFGVRSLDAFDPDGEKPTGLPLEFQLGDDELFDYAAVFRAGFRDYVALVEDVMVPVDRDGLSPDVPVEMALLVQPGQAPEIEITRKPDLLVGQGSIVLSGIARDDVAVMDVIVYHGEDKVYYRGGDGSVGSIPFSVDRKLEPGLNTFVVLVRDDRGLGVARSVSVYYDVSGSAG